MDYDDHHTPKLTKKVVEGSFGPKVKAISHLYEDVMQFDRTTNKS